MADLRRTPDAPAALSGYQVRLRTSDGAELTRVVQAVDVVAATREAAGLLAIDLPEAEIVAVEYLGGALQPAGTTGAG